MSELFCDPRYHQEDHHGLQGDAAAGASRSCQLAAEPGRGANACRKKEPYRSRLRSTGRLASSCVAESALGHRRATQAFWARASTGWWVKVAAWKPFIARTPLIFSS